MTIQNREKKTIPFMKALTDDVFIEGHILTLAPRLAGEIVGVTDCAD
jgi:hypothetical protein